MFSPQVMKTHPPTLGDEAPKSSVERAEGKPSGVAGERSGGWLEDDRRDKKC
jgi:hypothetical protein